MTHVISFRDAVNLDRSEPAFDMEFPNERVTVQELIRSRVSQEVEDFNAGQSEHFRGLVQPEKTEKTRHGYAFQDRETHIDWEEQYAKAIAAFEAGGFLILVNGKEVTGLDTKVRLGVKSEVTFLKLMPLVGG